MYFDELYCNFKTFLEMDFSDLPYPICEDYKKMKVHFLDLMISELKSYKNSLKTYKSL